MKEKKTEFQRQLQDPRWQKKRLEIMERDEWTCQRCGDTKATLTVHHKSYRFDGEKFADIWDYDKSNLITLCDLCHEKEEIKLKKIGKNVHIFLRSIFENAESITMAMDMFEILSNKLGRRIRQGDISSLTRYIIEVKP